METSPDAQLKYLSTKYKVTCRGLIKAALNDLKMINASHIKININTLDLI